MQTTKITPEKYRETIDEIIMLLTSDQVIEEACSQHEKMISQIKGTGGTNSSKIVFEKLEQDPKLMIRSGLGLFR
jgi:hypothetical protein